MKTVLTFITIIYLFNFNSFSQIERSRIFTNENEGGVNLSKPAFMDSTVLNNLINDAMSTYNIPGIAALITSRDDGIIWNSNFGFANVDLQQPVEDTTLFLTAGISSTIVATAIMQFWEADSFDLDDNINDYLDQFQVNIPYHYNDTVTFHMLLTYTSSIEDNWDEVLNPLTVCGDSPIPLDSFLVEYFTPGGIYYNSALNFYDVKPGTEWNYSGVAVCVLAYLVEKFSGMSFEQYCRENIFDPLEMNRTSWFLSGLDTNTIAKPYIWQGGQFVPYCQYGFPDYPDGQLRTTKIELEHFLSAYMNWGKYKGVSILDSSTIDLMLSDQLSYPPWPSSSANMGLLWMQSIFSERLPWGHPGWRDPGSNTGMFFKQNENQDWGIICFMNSQPGTTGFFYILNLLCDYVTDVEELYGPIAEFYLEQNYPNPFNPATKIKYSVSQTSNVVIKVFDILGNEIKTLVNEEKPVGSYELEFNAATLSSGIYFYRLQTGDFIETKKMVLMK